MEDWWSSAACVGHDPEWWSEEYHDGRATAVRICASCPVRRECLADAVRHKDFGVVRGGALLSIGRRRMVFLLCARCEAMPAVDVARARPYCRPCELKAEQDSFRVPSV